MSPETPVSYFTCTLGQATEISEERTRDFDTVTEFIDLQARLYPKRPAVGFPSPKLSNEERWGYDIFSFETLKSGSVAVANELSNLVEINNFTEEPKIVALICPSSEDFLFAWLGLMRAGFAVLLIAPQCQPEAIAHLCKLCEVSTLLCDKVYLELALASARVSPSPFTAKLFPWQLKNTSITSVVRGPQPRMNQIPLSRPTSRSVAYIHHTSGTSTGLPKPIPQTHYAGVGVLPTLSGSSAATFTITPLYHGGIADCFRSWTSGALIWLFPSGCLPITARNIVSSLSVARSAATENPTCIPEVKYFSSVPYVLQMMSEEKEGLMWLQRMDTVGVGGAALPDSVGDNLVLQGVNLISRFGSAECGFLLSSHRDYSADNNWQYLRVPSASPHLRFEEQGDGSGLSELVILKSWPHMAKTNREDGSFATNDLFEPHGEICGAWKYHSRSDSQITLITGKKFDPAPLEGAIVAAVRDIRDCFVFGNGRQAPGALVFVNEEIDEKVTDKELMDRIWAAIEEVNRKGQDHTRISRDRVVVRRHQNLQKSSKGTLMRGDAENEFSEDIKGVYAGHEFEDNLKVQDAGKPTKEIVRMVFSSVLGVNELDDRENFYQHGVDSTSCMRIRNLLGKSFHAEGKSLPWNVVYDSGNIEKLTKFLDEWQTGEVMNKSGSEEMLQLVDRYSVVSESAKWVDERSPIINKPREEAVILTGATGALGSHILSQLLSYKSVARIHCFVRAETAGIARERVLAALKQRFVLPDSKSSLEKLHCLVAKLDEENMGLGKAAYEDLRKTTTIIIYAAWPVNFSLPLSAFEPSLSGINSLINLSLSSSMCSKFVFCSSTAAILGHNHPGVVPEVISSSPEDSDSLGYSRSKWVAEAICSRFADNLSENGRVEVVRIGQLTGDTRHGVWNMSEAYPLMLSTVRELGCLPNIHDKLSWLPLDIAAKAVCEISLGGSDRSLVPLNLGLCRVHHVVNNNISTSFGDLLVWLKRIYEGSFEVVEPSEWLYRLEMLDNHPAKALLGLWRRAYEANAADRIGQSVIFDTQNAKKASKAMRDLSPIEERLFVKIWAWLEGELWKSS